MDTRELPEVNVGGGHGLLPMNALMEKARAVCYIQAIVENPRKNTDQLRYGSGFYSTVLINWVEYHGIFTNNHILSKEADAQWAEAVFGYDNYINKGKRVCLRPDLIFKTNEDLDYTFVGVQKEEIDALQLGVIITPIPFLPEPRICAGDEIFIPQHPKGRPKEFSHGTIMAANHPFVYYKADTEKGSSGAPVFWRLNLVAVHQEGREDQKYKKGALCSEILSHLNKETYTRPNPFSIEDSQENKMDQDCGIPKKEERLRRNISLSPSERELDKLAMEIIPIWKSLGRQLEVENSKIEEILRDNVNYPERSEKAFQMLLSWKDSSYNPSYDALGNALIQLGKRSLAKHYCCKS